MISTSIINWLDDPTNYVVGAELYAQHGDNPVLKEAFLMEAPYMGRNPVLADMMIQELKAIGSDLQQKTIKVGAQPEAIEQLEKRWRVLYKECAHLHAQLLHRVTDEERLETALHILNNMDEVEEIWHQVDHWKETGTMSVISKTDEDDFSHLDAHALYRQMRNLQANIAKTKKKIQQGSTKPGRVTQWAQKLEAMELRYERIKQIYADTR